MEPFLTVTIPHAKRYVRQMPDGSIEHSDDAKSWEVFSRPKQVSGPVDPLGDDDDDEDLDDLQELD